VMRLGFNWTRVLPNMTVAVLALWMLLGFTNWHDLAEGVRLGVPRADNDYAQHLLFDGPVQALPIAAAILLHLCAVIIGYALVVSPIWGRRRLASEIWLLLGGIIPGTLILMALSRLATLVLTNIYAPTVIWIAVIGLAGLSAVKARQRWQSEEIRLGGSDVCAALLLLTSIFVFTMQMDRFHIVGEASSWFINQVYLSGVNGVGTGAKFPLVSQHYDEAALLYPVIYGLVRRGMDTQGTLSVLYWIMVSLGRAGVGSLVYLSLRSLGVDRLSSIVSLAFVCLASLAVNPISSRLLFDSLSPLAYALHVARFLIPVLPLLLVSALGEIRGKVEIITWIVSAALGIGLSTMPIHAVLVLAWALPVVAIVELSPDAATAPGLWRTAAIFGSVVLVAFMLVYGLAHRIPASVCVTILLVTPTIAAFAVLVAWYRSGLPITAWDIFSSPFLLLLTLCAGYGLGAAFLGNIFISHTDGALAHIWPWAGMEIADRPVSDLGTSSGNLELSPYCSGYYWAFRNLAGHCSSLGMLVRTYGLAFAAMAGALAWQARISSNAARVPDRQRTMILWAILLCLFAMPISFSAFDFIAPANAPLEWQRELSIWLRSRLVEPWFYSGILLSLAFFLREAALRERRWIQSAMLVAIAVGGFVPLAMPGQMIVNFTFLFEAVLR
jgi:hypothetical protein